MIEAGANPDTLAVRLYNISYYDDDGDDDELIVGCGEGIKEGRGFFTGC
jgi:hypothetical protein